MDNEDKVFLIKIAKQLETWIEESLTGSWSTHQVFPMKLLSSNIYEYIGRKSQKTLNTLKTIKNMKYM